MATYLTEYVSCPRYQGRLGRRRFPGSCHQDSQCAIRRCVVAIASTFRPEMDSKSVQEMIMEVSAISRLYECYMIKVIMAKSGEKSTSCGADSFCIWLFISFGQRLKKVVVTAYLGDLLLFLHQHQDGFADVS